jgi:O-antigen/teichoic acid export membrane protein
MPTTTPTPSRSFRPRAPRPRPTGPPGPSPAVAPRRLATNFAALSVAEVACRGTSVAVTLALAHRLGDAGFGRIEFAFNLVYWLVLLVREGFDVIAAREIARHPRLIRPLVNHVLAIRGTVALTLLAGLVAVGWTTLTGPTERWILTLYGLMLLTTALGLDYVYRGLERMGLVAVSLFTRTAVYAAGVLLWVGDASRIVWVPILLVAGEACGIALVWACYTRRFGPPRPSLRLGRFLRVFLRRGRSVYLIQVSQAVIGSVDLLVVGLLSHWEDMGHYSAPHRLVTAVLTFGLIFQQVVFPSLARSWRDRPESGRRSMDALVRVLMLGLVPLAIGTTALAGPLVAYLLPAEFERSGVLLALGIWRAPLLTLAFLYQTSLIALNREAAGVRLLLAGAVGAVPMVALLRLGFGLPGAAAASIATGLCLAAAGYWRLAREGRQPAWHHHLGRPLLAAAAMVPACLALQGRHVLLAVGAGAVVYVVTLAGLGGLRADDVRTILGRGAPGGPARAGPN